MNGSMQIDAANVNDLGRTFGPGVADARLWKVVAAL